MMKAIKNLSHGWRSALSAVAITVGLATASIGLASPAQAAGTSAPDLSACFRYAASGAVYANQPIQLQTRYGIYRGGQTNGAGCGTWVDIAPNSIYKITIGPGSQPWAQTNDFFIGTAPAYSMGTIYF